MKRCTSLQRNLRIVCFALVNSIAYAVPLAQNVPPTTNTSKPELKAIEEKSPALDPAQDLPPQVREELQLMQAIEPNYSPKDDSAVQLFMLQKVVGDNDAAITDKKERTRVIRSVFTNRFRESLRDYASSRVGQRDKRYDRMMEDVISSYEQALRYHPKNSAYNADALYFLGLNYFEVDERDFFEKLVAYSKAREQGREDVAYPDENFSRTIAAYERLIKEYPNYRHMESVYYLLGLALWYEGQFYDAVERFQDLITTFPNSRYVEELWFRLGEYFFEVNDYEEALNAYTKVLNNPSSSLYDKAVYKVAWVYYQENKFNEAIKYFLEIVELSKKENQDGALGMRAEVIRYIVKSFADLLYIAEGKASPKPVKNAPTKKLSSTEKDYVERLGVKLTKRILAYFDAMGQSPSYLRDILFETTKQLLEESKNDGAILALRSMMEREPGHKDNPRLNSEIVDILEDAERLEEARAENLALIERFGKNSAWYRSMAGNFEAQSYAKEAVRDALLSLAVFYHKGGKERKEAKDPKASEYFDNAARMYARYVKEYPERDDVEKAIFYFAESSYELNRFRTALDAYQLLKDYPLPLAKNLRSEAVYNIVFTFRHVLENEAKENRFQNIDFDALTSKQRGSEEREIPALGLRYLSAIDDFLALAPEDPQVPVLLFHAAAIYYVYGHAEEASTRLGYIIDKYPVTPAASVAARLILDDAIAAQDWSRVSQLARRFKEQNLGGQEKDFARIEGNARFRMARAVFDEADKLKENNQLSDARAKYKESAELFAVLLREDPSNPYADVMLFNSARAITQSGLLSSALPLYRELYTKYPKSELAKDARFQEALALEKMIRFNEAALAYDGIIKNYPKTEIAADAALNKALLFEAADDAPRAIDAFVSFASNYPSRPEAPQALLAAAGMYKKQGKINSQILMLEQFIKQYRKDANKLPAVIEAHVAVADTYGELFRTSRAASDKARYEKLQLANYKAALSLYSPSLGSPEAAFFAAKAELFVDKPEQEAFKKMRINARTGKAQAEQLTAMMQKLSDLSAKNEAIIKKYAQPVWNAESLYRIGALYEHLAQSMVRAPCPSDVEAIDEYACDEYIVLLEDKAAVLDEKAVSAYAQAYDIAINAYDTPDDLVTRIQGALNRLKPGKYQRVGDVIEKPETGAFYGRSRMLSTGEMASSLHPEEVDPDRKKNMVPASSESSEGEGPQESKPSEESAP